MAISNERPDQVPTVNIAQACPDENGCQNQVAAHVPPEGRHQQAQNYFEQHNHACANQDHRPYLRVQPQEPFRHELVERQGEGLQHPQVIGQQDQPGPDQDGSPGNTAQRVVAPLFFSRFLFVLVDFFFPSFSLYGRFSINPSHPKNTAVSGCFGSERCSLSLPKQPSLMMLPDLLLCGQTPTPRKVG